MRALEARTQPQLFTLRLAPNVKRHIGRPFRVSGWIDAGQGCAGLDGTLALGGYACAVLVTNPDREILARGQPHRDRADAGNALDALKIQWGRGGFTTNDLHRCQLSARAVVRICNGQDARPGPRRRIWIAPHPESFAWGEPPPAEVGYIPW